MSPGARRWLVLFSMAIPVLTRSILTDDVRHRLGFALCVFVWACVYALFTKLLDYAYFGHWSVTHEEWERWAVLAKKEPARDAPGAQERRDGH